MSTRVVQGCDGLQMVLKHPWPTSLSLTFLLIMALTHLFYPTAEVVLALEVNDITIHVMSQYGVPAHAK
jgi:hypothetical protein